MVVDRAIADRERARVRRRANARLEALFEYTSDPVSEYEFDGDGITPEDRERVFESGYTTGAEGTGARFEFGNVEFRGE